tara:strand:+ start:1117 stop:1362 length:246 start_codon:yes stop_codon:yes gene_type:complete
MQKSNISGSYDCQVGTLIRDRNRVGIIYREIKQGTWTDQPLFNWKTNFEIYYDDGTICIMGSDTLQRLITSGAIELLEDEK